MKLSIIKDAIEQISTSYESRYFFNKETEEVICVEDNFLSLAEEGEDQEFNKILNQNNWETKQLKTAIYVLENWNKKIISLPEKYEIYEYSMMEDFIETIKDIPSYNKLSIAIRGKGAFGNFRATCDNLKLLDKWYDYKDNCYKEVARKWLGYNDIVYEKDI